MARQEINLGVLPNGVGGDTPRVANTKINDMTAELYAAIESVPGGTVKTVAGVDPDAAGDIPKAQLATALGVDDKVDKVAGKGLSSNDFTTTEKTKLSSMVNPASYGVGGPAIPVTEGDCNKAVAAGNYRTIPTTLNGRNVFGVLEVFDYGDDGNSKIQRLTATYGHPIGEAMWFRTGTDQGTLWGNWQRLVNTGNYGVGSDPRTGSPAERVGAINDANVLLPGGTYLVHVETLNSPKVYGTLRMEWYDANGWTQTITQINEPIVWVRGCINGSVQPWTRSTPETITNANGTATKFPDGTLICRWSASARDSASNPQGPLFISTARFQTFAVPFVGETPTVSPASSDPNNAHCWGVVTSAGELTRVQVAVMSAASNGQARPGYIAVGRWR
ncbi:hypothetical protein P2W50_00685 [Pseudomonas protegens]|uniref:hypothetical protein n=1 Tax=Pseudomonas protegens TaxID=380021 RepID=UPI0023EAA161|nr:hypothetical protein [Pseudomonas protegens]MDF4205107.1 hypothetical protein [Pseudomonas protegens]